VIVLRNLTKTFRMEGVRKTVADNINMTFPTGVSVGLLGRNGSGKSTLLKLIAGTSTPTWGEVLSTGSLSFPVGLASSLHADLTGAQNTRFVARIYGADTDSLSAWVEEFAELGQHFHLPVRSYSSGMRGRLSFGINMGLAFDTYLVDEITAVGDASFRRKSTEVFQDRMQRSGAIFVSHSMGQIRELCTAGALLEHGRLTYYEEVEEAIDRYLFSLDPTHGVQGGGPQEDDDASRLPAGVRLVYGLGLEGTHAEWLGDCLRRHSQCLCPPVREPHYFDIRAGRSARLLRERDQQMAELVAALPRAQGEARGRLLRRIDDQSALLQVHVAPADGPDRHDAYLAYMQRHRRKAPLLCDLTPSYARLRRADFAEMAGLGGAFLLVLRDPVDRLWETLCLERPEARRTPEACLAALDALLAGPPEEIAALRPEAGYARILERLAPEAGEDGLVVTFHERLADPATRFAELDAVCAAIGAGPLPADRRPPFPEPPGIPPLPEDRAERLAAALAPEYAAMRARFGDALPAAWRVPPPPGAPGEAGDAPPEAEASKAAAAF
jgi:ABC-type polysaccharide/polyol phosphate transport system ATPase subunit